MLAGGEIPGKREFDVSDKPRVVTLFDVVWQAIDIGGYGEREAIQIRLGDSLLLTAGTGQTNVEVAITITDASGSAFGDTRHPALSSLCSSTGLASSQLPPG